MELTLKERLFLANQYETLIKLSDEENAETYEKALEIVEKGYTNLYDELFSAVSKNNLSIGECKLVESILELYSDLKFARDNSSEISSTFSEHDIKFKGFDGHLSKNYAAYAEFLVLKENRWSEFKETIKNLDSHGAFPDLDGLKLMVERRKEIDKSWDKLTVDDIKTILGR
ncbi:YfbU family protein [Lactococcus petauri]|uniref:YfbU family protein n=1 Tax=Lactococcus petauri TaxID=1940789 RepID=UPI0013FDD32B|nr:YfbU family protein [Lactococcus petauri]NHI79421.1 YfbU family protein [Lactococcus petauri]